MTTSHHPVQQGQHQPQPPPPGWTNQAPAPSAPVGFAVTALVLGILGTLFGLIPLTAPLALGLGVIGLVFALVALLKRNRKGLTISGLVLSIIALVLAVWGLVVMTKATDKLVDELNAIASPAISASGSPAESGAGKSNQVHAFGTTLSTSKYDITIGAPTAFTPSQSSLSTGPTTAFKVTVKNTSSEPLSLALTTVNAMHDSTAADTVYDSAKGIEGAPSTRLRPGQQTSWTAVFEGKPTGTWDVDASVDFGAKAMFSSKP